MGISLTNARPSTHSQWGEGNPAPATHIQEPPGAYQTAAWQAGGFPPAPFMNWLHYTSQRWDKNLDERAPRIPTIKWFVGEQSGAHFATLAAALASSDVLAGHVIYFSPSVANSTLTAAITVSKGVKIICEHGAVFTKGAGSPTRAFILSADYAEIYGARFSNNWNGVSDACIEITGSYCRVIECNFASNANDFINDTAVAAGKAPILSQNIVEH